MHTFTGLLDTSESATDAGFRVKLYMTDAEVVIATFDGESWKWGSDDVSIRRIKADRYRLDLGSEALFFAPDDPLNFTLKALQPDPATGPEVTGAPGRGRGWLRRRIEEAAASGVEADEPDYVPDTDQDEPVQLGRRRHAHTWEETMASGVARRRCVECGRVSIDLSRVTSMFETGIRPPSRAAG